MVVVAGVCALIAVAAWGLKGRFSGASQPADAAPAEEGAPAGEATTRWGRQRQQAAPAPGDPAQPLAAQAPNPADAANPIYVTQAVASAERAVDVLQSRAAGASAAAARAAGSGGSGGGSAAAAGMGATPAMDPTAIPLSSGGGAKAAIVSKQVVSNEVEGYREGDRVRKAISDEMWKLRQTAIAAEAQKQAAAAQQAAEAQKQAPPK